jgi:PAS domain S-box-containing protein
MERKKSAPNKPGKSRAFVVNESLRIVNRLAIDLAQAESERATWQAICDRLMDIPGVFSTSASVYHRESGQMETIIVNFPPERAGIISRAEKLMGESILGLHMPVDAETLRMLLQTPVATGKDLNEVSFGKIPRIAAKAVNAVFGLGGFYGLAFSEGGELYGTSMIVMKRGFVPLTTDVRETIAKIGAVAIGRARINDRLRKSEEKFRSLVNSLHDRVMVLDHDLRQVEVYGTSTKARDNQVEEFLGKTSQETAGPEAARPHIEAGKRALAGESVQYEWSWSEPGEEIAWYRTRLTPIKGSDGGTKEIVSVSHEISDLKKAVEVARESGARFRSLFDNMQEGLAYCRMVYRDGKAHDFIYMSVNPAFVRQTGLKDVEGKAVSEVIPGIRETDQQLLDTYGRVASSGRAEKFESYVKALGDWFAVSVYCPAEGYFVAIFEVITPRKLLEEQVRVEQESFRSLVEGAPDAIFVQAGGRFLYLNPPAVRLFGATDAGELVGRDYFAYIAPEFHEIIRQRIRFQVETGKSAPLIEMAYIRMDGTRVPVETTAMFIRYQGTDAHVVFVRDISERNKAEEELRKTREWLELTQQSANIGSWDWDMPTGKLLWSDTFFDLFGLSRDTIPDFDVWRSLVHPDDREAADARINLALERHEPLRNEYRIIRPDGGIAWILANGTAAYDSSGKPYRMSGVCSDITPIKMAEASVREYASRLELALQSSKMGVWHWDIRENKRFFDEPTCRMLGLDCKSFSGTAEEFYGAVHPDDREKLKQALANTMETDSLYEPEYRVIWPDGSVHHIAARARLIRDSVGKPYRVNGVAWDITERKKIEEEHQRLQADLFQAQKMESIGTLAGGIAHDFNNLLMGISGNMELMEMDIEKGAKLAPRIGKVSSLVERGSELTSQLLGFARKGKYDAKPISLEGLVSETSSMFSRMRKDIKVSLDIEKGVSAVLADFTQIEQVLLNLLVNAGQAMPTGGEVRVALANETLSGIQASGNGLVPGRFVRLEVTDSGMGMDSDTMSKIFDPFFTTKERGKGTGLGLASAYGIVRHHGGYIGVESQPGQGAKFTVHLPATDLPVAVIPARFDGVRVGRENILVVDDEEMILDVSRAMLEAMGYTVLVAHGGAEAVEMVKNTGNIDLVILDMVMPGMSGREAFEAIRKTSPAMKVILASGYSIEGQAEEIMSKGCNGFIQKPFNSASLSEKIGEVLR